MARERNEVAIHEELYARRHGNRADNIVIPNTTIGSFFDLFKYIFVIQYTFIILLKYFNILNEYN